MTESLVDDEQGGFRAGMGCLDQIFILKKKVRKHNIKILVMWFKCARVFQESLFMPVLMYGSETMI